MTHNCDVLVIGAGIAGVAAALAAAQEGARVCVIRAGPATTALSIGAWRGALPARVRQQLSGAGYALEPCGRTLPRPDGTLLHADDAPVSHARAAITGERTLICGIAGLPAFHATALSALWADAAGAADTLIAATVSLADTPPAGWSPVSLAAQLEREPPRLAEPLAGAMRSHDATRAIVPAVLGLEAHAVVHADIEARVGMPVGEALGGTPSLPGWRLDVALRAALANAAVNVIAARVTSHHAAAQQVDAVTCSSGAGETTIRAASIILATGKFLGGGIAADPQFRETALGCDVVVYRFDRAFDNAAESLLLTGEARLDAQPLLCAGVRADAESRPLNAFGDVVYRNVFIAGSIRADLETAALGLGTAASDGWNAGVRAASLARAAA